MKEIKSKITKKEIYAWKEFIAKKKTAPTIIVIDKTQTIVVNDNDIIDRVFMITVVMALIFAIGMLSA